MTDTIADLLTRIRNASKINKRVLILPFSKHKKAILEVIKKYHYLDSLEEIKEGKTVKKQIKITIGQKNITHIKRISKPGQRIFVKSKNIPKPLRGFGLVIISTPKGVISGYEAKKKNLGGEIICEVW